MSSPIVVQSVNDQSSNFSVLHFQRALKLAQLAIGWEKRGTSNSEKGTPDTCAVQRSIIYRQLVPLSQIESVTPRAQAILSLQTVPINAEMYRPGAAESRRLANRLTHRAKAADVKVCASAESIDGQCRLFVKTTQDSMGLMGSVTLACYDSDKKMLEIFITGSAVL